MLKIINSHISKIITTLIIMLICYINVNAENMITKWTKSAGGTNEDLSQSIAIDNKGNTYVAGYFSSSSLTIGTTSLSNSNPGSKHVFIAKFDSIGNLMWARSTGNYDIGYGLSVTVDLQGNVMMSGSYNSSSITFGSFMLSNNGGSMYGLVFLVKYDSLGNVLWARSSSNTYSSNSMISICSDQSGFIYATGHFQDSSITFGTITLTNSSAPDQEVFLVKYDASGNAIWAKSFGGATHDVGNSVAVDPVGNVFVAGYFASSSITIGSNVLLNKGSGSSDIFIAKYSSTGTLLWAKSVGGAAFDYINSLAVDNTGNAIIGGYFKSSSMDFGNGVSLNNTTTGYVKDFLVKFDGSGKAIWAKAASNSTTNDAINSVCADKFGNIYTTGYYESKTIKFDTITLTNAGSATQDIFITKNDNAGKVIWAKSVGGTGNDYGKSICSDSKGNAFVTGEFMSSSISFDSFKLNNVSTGTNDVFVAKVFSNNNSTDSITLNYCKNDTVAKLVAYDGYTSYSWSNSVGTVIGIKDSIDAKIISDSTIFLCTMTSGPDVKKLYVTILKYDPRPDFSFKNNCLSNTVQFKNLSTKTRGSLSYKWDFGDGSYSNIENPQHTFSTSGKHQVSLQIDNLPSTCSLTSSKTVETFLSSMVGIDGDSTFCPTYSTVLKAHGASHYKWSTGSTADSIVVGIPGKIWLLGYSSAGCVTDTIFKMISKEPEWSLEIDGNHILCEYATNQIIASGAVKYTWSTGETTNAIKITSAGSYTVIGTNKRGCVKSKTFQLVTDLAPQLDFQMSAIQIDSKHNELTCSIPALDNVVYVWDMGDGLTENGSEIKHAYNISSGIFEYRITLTAKTPNGCEFSKSKSIDIVPFIPNVFTPNGDGANDLFMPDYDLTILDRNGRKLYAGKSGWNGTFNGLKVDNDTYFYLINYTDKNQLMKTKKGYVILIR